MAGVNNIVKYNAPKAVFEDAKNGLSSAVSWNQGDLLYFDDTNNLIKKPTAETDGATFLGVARCTIVSGKVASPYNTDVVASQPIAEVPGPLFGVTANLVIKTGDSIAFGDFVYLDPATGSTGVTVTGTKKIGIYQGPAITGAAAGTLIPVLLGTQINGALQF